MLSYRILFLKYFLSSSHRIKYCWYIRSKKCLSLINRLFSFYDSILSSSSVRKLIFLIRTFSTNLSCHFKTPTSTSKVGYHPTLSIAVRVFNKIRFFYNFCSSMCTFSKSWKQITSFIVKSIYYLRHYCKFSMAFCMWT